MPVFPIKSSPEEYKMKFEIENQWLLIAKKNRKVAASFWLLEQPRPLFAAAQAPGGVRRGTSAPAPPP